MKELDALLESEEEESAEEESDEEEEQPSQKLRRGADGRFEGMPNKMRPVYWAQLSRRGAPSAVPANIQDVLSVYAPDIEIEHPTERQTQLMRGEVLPTYCVL